MSKKRHKNRKYNKSEKKERKPAKQGSTLSAGITAILTVLGTLFLTLAAFFWTLNHTVSIYLLFISFGIYAIGLFIELLKHNWGKFHAAAYPGLLILLGIALCAGLKQWDSRQEDEFSGILVPANDPTPASMQVPTNAVLLILGNSMSEVFWFPHTVIMYKGKPILTISTNSQGATVSGDFFGDNNDIVATLENNRFTINRLNYFTKERPDKSTLILKDQRNIQCLNVRFMNPHTIKLLGRFRFPNEPDLLMDEHEGIFSRHMFSGACMVDFSIR